MNASLRWAKAYEAANAAAPAGQGSAEQLELAGPAEVALASALIVAVLGWRNFTGAPEVV